MRHFLLLFNVLFLANHSSPRDPDPGILFSLSPTDAINERNQQKNNQAEQTREIIINNKYKVHASFEKAVIGH